MSSDFFSRMSRLFRVLPSIGLGNVFVVARYRMRVRLGLFGRQNHQDLRLGGPFFSRPKDTVREWPSLSWNNQVEYFGHLPVPVGLSPPDWHANPINGASFPPPLPEWWAISDFNENLGDIKCLWEASRFSWVLAFSQRVLAGQTEEYERLERWLRSWVQSNPPYKGVNWKCGQESSIRVLHLAVASVILKQEQCPTKTLLSLIELHMKRIEPTIFYAMAQDNNHGVSEAGALFVGGSWLASQGSEKGRKWQRLGAKWLENRAQRLIALDGGFSMYSTTYHREALDVFCIVEVWRKRLGLRRFSRRYESKVLSAAEWLRSIVSVANGDAPNIGANDGSRLLPLTDTDYRDFRPTVQMASVLFGGRRAWSKTGTWDVPLRWLNIAIPKKVAEPLTSRVFDDVGFAVLKRSKAMAVMRYPRFRYRPAQADALHVDLWVDGINLLRDAGSYSYNTKPEWLAYFSGTESHNTVQFDGRDQMPRIGRFLFGDWVRAVDIEPLREDENDTCFAAGYRDRYKAYHNRKIRLSANKLRVEDRLEGFRRNAVLRWRLAPQKWEVNGDMVTNGEHVLRIKSSMPIVRMSLVEGWESRYYAQKTKVPVLEVEFCQPGTVYSEYSWLI